jgi:hypothetical protein
VSPIFVRPVREQLEHDRLIRFLHGKYKRKFEVAVNTGEEQAAPVKIGTGTFFPDLVLTEGRRLAGVIEVESAESVNNLEAMAQWVPFSRARVPFHLYVPVTAYDAARRLCEANQAGVAEIWTYRPTFDGFDLVRMLHTPPVAAPAASRRGAAENGRKAGKAAVKPKRPPVAERSARPARAPKPAASAKAVRPRRAAAVRPKSRPAKTARAKGGAVRSARKR